MHETLLSKYLKSVEYVKNGCNNHQDSKSQLVGTHKICCKEQCSTYQCKQIENQTNHIVRLLFHGNLLCLVYSIGQLASSLSPFVCLNHHRFMCSTLKMLFACRKRTHEIALIPEIRFYALHARPPLLYNTKPSSGLL